MKPHSLPQTCVTAMTISILFTITAKPNRQVVCHPQSESLVTKGQLGFHLHTTGVGTFFKVCTISCRVKPQPFV